MTRKKKLRAGELGKYFLFFYHSCVSGLSGIQYYTISLHHLLQLYRLYRYESHPSEFCGTEELPKSF